MNTLKDTPKLMPMVMPSRPTAVCVFAVFVERG